MSDKARRSEQERRGLAQQHAGEVVEGSGRVVTPRRLGEMISLRLEPALAEALRELADRQGVSLSELLREAAVRLVEAGQVTSRTTFVVSVPEVPTSTTTSRNVSVAS